MKRIKAILFDMDGVLIDAKEWHYEALNRALGLFGMHISRYDHLVTYDGLPTKKKLDMLTLERGLPRELHEFINKMKQLYTIEYVQSQCKPLFFHEFALSRLSSEGYRLGVCSNSIRMTVEMMIGNAKLTRFFDVMLSNQDVTNSKPHPEIYQKAIARLEISPSECLILEDNINGIKAAEASGAHVMRIDAVENVNYQSIKAEIRKIEERSRD